MEFFTFKAYGSIFTVKAEKGLDVMEQANAELLWGNTMARDGMWEESAEKNTYHWVEGNFFD